MKHVLLTLGLLTLPTALATRYPLTITDDLGRKVTIAKEPQRVISLLPSNTETICAIGACDKLVGVDDYSDFPAQVKTLPKVGNLYQPNIEAMVALKPDVVVVSKYGQLIEPLARAGVTVVAINPEKYEEIFSKTSALGKLLNREKGASAVNTKISRDVARVEVLTRNSRKVRTYLEIDPTPYSVGPNSFMGVLLSKAGAANIIPATLGDFPQISPELVVQQNPALMLGLTLDAAKKRPGWNNISAVKSGAVKNIPSALNTMLGRPGPRIGEALLGLAKLVHPELFK